MVFFRILASAGSSYYVKNRSYATVNLELAYDAATDSIKAYANGVEKSFGDKFPVGTILPYIGSLYTIPPKWALCDGNNGTPNLTGRFLQGWGWDDFYWRSVGEYIQEGLPNITGYVNGSRSINWDHLEGAFFDTGSRDGADIYVTALNGHTDDFFFDASRCSWLYGNSATVQPRSYVVYYIMKIQA